MVKTLRKPFGDVGRGAGHVPHDDLHLLAAGDVSVLAQVELDPVVDLLADVGEGTRELGDDADLDHAVPSGASGGEGGNAQGAERGDPFHVSPFGGGDVTRPPRVRGPQKAW